MRAAVHPERSRGTSARRDPSTPLGVNGSVALGLLCLVFAACPPPVAGPEAVVDPLPYASPLMGTGGFAYFHGSAFPGACVPHGLVKVGPDTRGAKYGDLRFIHYSGYWAGDDTALGFSHLHLHGAGATN